MDYYDILGISKKATDIEIRKAYKKLAIKYHPDKNQDDPSAEEKFKEIAKAYQTLSDKSKRRVYDLTGNDDNQTFDAFNIFNNFFEKMANNFSFGNFGFNDDIRVEIFNHHNEEVIKKTDNIYYNIHAKLEDIYSRKIKKITLKHKRCVDDQYIEVPIDYKIPLHMRETIFYEEAHEKRNYNKKGDVIITIYDKDHEKFKRINDFDLIMTHHINLFDIYKGFSFQFSHLDGEIIYVNSRPESLKEQGHFYQKIVKKGLPNGEEDRGDLFIRYIINFPHIEKIEKICDGHDYENIDYDNNLEYNAKNCPYEEIYKDNNDE